MRISSVNVRKGPVRGVSRRFCRSGSRWERVRWTAYCYGTSTDYLDRPSAQALATALGRLLRPDGALLGFFGNANHAGSGCTKFTILDESHRPRAHASVLVREGSLQNRDIIKMFDGMRVSDAFQSQTGRCEMLFRKGGGRLIT